MFMTKPELLGLLWNLYFMMFGTQFGRVVICITFSAKMCFLSNTVELRLERRVSGAIITQGMLWLLLFVWVNDKINEIAWIYLIVFKDSVFVKKDLRIGVFIVKVNRVKSFRTLDRFFTILWCAITIRFPYSDFTHHKTELLLGSHIDILIVANIESHSFFSNIKTLLADFFKFVLVYKLFRF